MHERPPETIATDHDEIGLEFATDGTKRADHLFALDNDRQVVITSQGVYDFRDWLEAPHEPDKTYAFVSWNELLELLDRFRAQTLN
jgi:hypothetical protein